MKSGLNMGLKFSLNSYHFWIWDLGWMFTKSGLNVNFLGYLDMKYGLNVYEILVEFSLSLWFCVVDVCVLQHEEHNKSDEHGRKNIKNNIKNMINKVDYDKMTILSFVNGHVQCT